MIVINLVYGYLKNVDIKGYLKIGVNKDIYTENEVVVYNENKIDDENWKIKIPKIRLETSIVEGVSEAVLNKSVGHYENSGITTGNICLKAYSNGNSINYFENIKSLRAGDEIIYKKDNFIRTYIVDFSGVINYNDLSYLKQTDEDMITLITNIENETNYLRCVQAVIEEN